MSITVPLEGFGGGSNPLNFKVVGGASAPASPKENTIWVNTDLTITGWVFSDDNPFPIGEITNNAGEILLTDGAICFEKANAGKMAYRRTYVKPSGSTAYYETILTLSKDSAACAVKVRNLVTNNVVGASTAPQSFVHNGETYYYAVAVQETSYTPSQAEAEVLLPIYNGVGTVWFKLDENSMAPFNTLKKNCIQVHPTAAKQLTETGWKTAQALIYQEGAWRDPLIYLFYEGQVNSNLAGGINGYVESYGSEYIYFSDSIAPAYNKTFTTVNKIDLTNYNSVKAVYRSSNEEDGPYFRLLVDDAAADDARVTTENLVAYKNSGSHMRDEMHELTLDISSLSGEYYLGFAWCNSSSVEDTHDVLGYVYRWWLE